MTLSPGEEGSPYKNLFVLIGGRLIKFCYWQYCSFVIIEYSDNVCVKINTYFTRYTDKIFQFPNLNSTIRNRKFEIRIPKLKIQKFSTLYFVSMISDLEFGNLKNSHLGFFFTFTALKNSGLIRIQNSEQRAGHFSGLHVDLVLGIMFKEKII
jgi:hypothetical protein